MSESKEQSINQLSTEPPPLFDNVDIFDKDEDNDDLFASAMDDIGTLNNENSHSPKPLLTELPKLQLNFDKGEQSTPTPVDEFDEEVKLQSPEPPKATKASAEEIEKDGNDQFIEITIGEPSRVGEGMASYVAYRVHTHTNIPLFRKKTFAVHRRFSDFLGLHDKLVDKYLRAGRIIPPAPEKSMMGTTKVKMSGQNEQGPSSEFIERRRAALERYLRRTAEHPTFRVDPDFREFLEADMELPKATNTSALSGAGVMRLFNKVGETVNKITYKMDENDPWFEEKVQQVESLDAQLRKLLLSVETLVMGRRDLAQLTSAFAKSAAILSNCEEHSSLSRVLAQLTDVEEKVEAVHNDQSNTDFAILYELLRDYVALIGSVKDVFHERVKVYQNWQHSQLMLNKKREQKAKLDLANKPDKATVAQEIVEWEAKVERCQEEFTSISKMIKKELERFDVSRVKDFKATIIKYMEEQMTHQQQLIKHWEAFLPEAKAIA
ncbi:sorting nexin-2-like [Macrosteles quadrilineatus]|uniref:sorting nexin-2-like n=1 Tax=Macrosteles quadrilineatus TaxID=74068 RepID=UPI0023E2513E|nr:sorting nexin-2-like [Macrosteles quadrilineatus]XP_054278701.1 sorting nexin-2-like [Macrosteles quadrilineatus]